MSPLFVSKMRRRLRVKENREGTMHSGVALRVGIQQWGFPRAIATYVVANELVWVRAGVVAGEKLKLQLALEGSDVGGDDLGRMGRMAIHPKENWRRRRMASRVKSRRNVMKRSAFT